MRILNKIEGKIMNNIQLMVRDICKEKNIDFKLVSKDWIMILQKDNIIKYIVGYKFDLNDHATGQICDDKYALYDTLNSFNIPVVKHYIIFRNYDKIDVISYARKHDFNIVVKSNTGTCGNNMYHTTNENDLFIAIDKLLAKFSSISISPYYEIKNEYRAIILKDNVEIFYGKQKPIVVGDGKHTIYELLIDFNRNYFKKIEIDDKLSQVLVKGEIYEYNWQFNLSKGAIPFFVEDINFKNKVQELALETAKILNLKFASVDVIELESGKILILEANSGVMMENLQAIISNGKVIVRNIYEKAIEEMFK